MPLHNPEISIISISFNEHRDTHEMLESLQKTSQGVDFEVVIVDNGSDIPFQLNSTYNFHVEVAYSESNLGFSGGNNLGVEKAQGKYLFFLNNDTLVTDNLISELKGTLERHPKAVLVSPKIVFHHGEQRLQYAGCTPIDPYFGRGFALGHNQPNNPSFSKEEPTGRVHGAAMMISKADYLHHGKMEDSFFLYYEEMDFNQRVLNAGGEVWYNGRAKVYHKESATVGKESALKVYYLFRNRMWFMWRNFGLIPNVVFAFYIAFLVFPVQLLKRLKAGNKTLVKALIKGFVHGWS